MRAKFARQTGRWKLLSASLATLAFIIGVLLIEYHQYAYAVAWHCVHGNNAIIAGHRVRLPIFWWKEEAEAYDTTVLVRAYPASAFLKPEIEVKPALPGAVQSSDQDELKSMQNLISALNKQSIVGITPSSLVVLKPRPFTLYCKKHANTLSGVNLDGGLFCLAATVPYGFIYSGPQQREKEAESILSTLE